MHIYYKEGRVKSLLTDLDDMTPSEFDSEYGMDKATAKKQYSKPYIIDITGRCKAYFRNANIPVCADNKLDSSKDRIYTIKKQFEKSVGNNCKVYIDTGTDSEGTCYFLKKAECELQF